MEQKVDRVIHDSMFKFMYSYDAYQRDLIVVLCGERYKDKEITSITLAPVFSQDVQNDLGLLVDDVLLLLVEAQSTVPTNIAIRMLEYVTRTLMSRIDADTTANLYGARRISLPSVRLYVVYTGEKPVPRSYRLLDNFTGPSDIDVIVHVLSRDTPKLPHSVIEYIIFSNKVTELVNKGVRGTNFVSELLQYCRTNNILTNFLKYCLEEVKAMMSAEERRELQRQKDRYDWIQEGRNEGSVEGRRDGLTEALHNLMENLHMSENEARKALGLPTEHNSVDPMSLQ